jgi:hypothetical protein
MARIIIAEYRGNAFVKLNINDNEFNREADFQLEAAEWEYDVGPLSDVTYAGLVPLSPDGAIQQVSWSVGGSGAITRASRNGEHHPFIPGYQERKRQARIAATEAAIDARLAALLIRRP